MFCLCNISALKVILLMGGEKCRKIHVLKLWNIILSVGIPRFIEMKFAPNEPKHAESGALFRHYPKILHT